MGNISPQRNLVEITNNETLTPWTEIDKEKNVCFIQYDNMGTIEYKKFRNVLLDAFRIVKFNMSKHFDKLKILEVCSGNGFNTKLLYDDLKNEFGNIEFIASDLMEHKPVFFNDIKIMDSKEAVNKYGNNSNILLMISPPCNDVFADFYAIREFERCKENLDKVSTNTETKLKVYTIFVGEIGQADGTCGIKEYLEEKWKLIYDEPFEYFRDIFNDNCSRNVYVYTY